MGQEKCKIHPENDVIEPCVHCGRGVCTTCAVTLAGKTYCIDCIKTVDASVAGQINEVLWEKRFDVGFMKAVFLTWKNVLLHPKRFFSEMPIKGGLRGPLLFALVWGSVAIVIAALINILLQVAGVAVPTLPPGTPLPPKAVMVATYLVLMLLSPLLVTIGIFFAAGVYHLMVLIFGGRQGFQATFRVISYSNAISIFNLLPVMGPIIVAVYSIVLFGIGFKRAHKISTARAVFAALLPMVLLFVIGFLAAYILATQGALSGLPATLPAK